MQKMYSKASRLESVDKKLVPKEETIRFLLDYSKALSITDYQDMKFEVVRN